jgi:hypothetical protein
MIGPKLDPSFWVPRGSKTSVSPSTGMTRDQAHRVHYKELFMNHEQSEYRWQFSELRHCQRGLTPCMSVPVLAKQVLL